MIKKMKKLNWSKDFNEEFCNNYARMLGGFMDVMSGQFQAGKDGSYHVSFRLNSNNVRIFVSEEDSCEIFSLNRFILDFITYGANADGAMDKVVWELVVKYCEVDIHGDYSFDKDGVGVMRTPVCLVCDDSPALVSKYSIEESE